MMLQFVLIFPFKLQKVEVIQTCRVHGMYLVFHRFRVEATKTHLVYFLEKVCECYVPVYRNIMLNSEADEVLRLLNNWFYPTGLYSKNISTVKFFSSRVWNILE